MSAPVFFVVSRKPLCEPLVPEFLFGEYSRDTESRCFSNTISADDVAHISKNIRKFPKIIGESDWIVCEQYKDLLTNRIDVKWRPVVILEPFSFDWNEKDGFELLEEHHELQTREFIASGKSEDECESLITTDPGLVYREFVDRYRVDFHSEIRYFELVAQHATVDAKTNRYDDVVSMTLEFGSAVFARKQAESDSLFSITSLEQFGLLSLGYGNYAVTAEAFSVLRDFVEKEYYDVVSIGIDSFKDF